MYAGFRTIAFALIESVNVPPMRWVIYDSHDVEDVVIVLAPFQVKRVASHPHCS